MAVRRPPASDPTSTIVPFPNGVPVTVPWSSTVPCVAGGTEWVLPVIFTGCARRLPGPARRGGQLVGVLQVVLEHRRLALRGEHERARQPARPVAPALRQREPLAERAELPDRQLRVLDLRVALHHVRVAAGRDQLEHGAALVPAPCVGAADRPVRVRWPGRDRPRCGSGSSPPSRIFSPWNARTRPVEAVAESIRKWRGPLSMTSVSPSSFASLAASNARHFAAGHVFSPIVFQTVTPALGGRPFSSMISQ